MAKGKRVNVANHLKSAVPAKRDQKQAGGARRPKLGQHFLADSTAAHRIVDSLDDIAQETVVEIGPGRGALTALLAQRARRVIAIELDRVMAAQLRMRFATSPNVEIIEGDVLAIDFGTVLGPKPGMSRPGLVQAPTKVHLVGNLPYYITSDILLRVFEFHQYFDIAVMMVQREVAERLAAKPGGREYGLLSATAQLYSKVELLFTLPPSAFNPPPKVDSAVVRLTIKPQGARLRVPEEEFIDFVKLAFGFKRKTLWNNLKSHYDSKALTEALRRAGVQPGIRAEALSLEKMAAIFRGLQPLAAD